MSRKSWTFFLLTAQISLPIYISDCTNLQERLDQQLNQPLGQFELLRQYVVNISIEPLHLSQVQAGDDRKGDGLGKFPQVGLNLLLFTFCLTNFLCGQEHAVVSSSHQSKPVGKYDFAVNK